ncbi:MAG: hypothetical protein P0Y53_10380 [Candidatus Pseudobacter hemicellulosilyticus]|uniref:Uncharacterized protein n=1 Tax=Candidatus Pseudobacter hemicellulosilyticus TaxID=3121375 RepID=A0AAJ5X0M2_9BACT|nr:MAG: hypothetical protein P0Y53_10380 [Pseudobacter sp.]
MVEQYSYQEVFFGGAVQLNAANIFLPLVYVSATGIDSMGSFDPGSIPECFVFLFVSYTILACYQAFLFWDEPGAMLRTLFAGLVFGPPGCCKKQ